MTITTPPEQRLTAALDRLGLQEATPAAAVPPIAMPMQMGLDARSWVVVGADGPVFVRLFDAALPHAALRDLDSVAAKQAAAAGVGPAVIAADADLGLQATAFQTAPWHMAMRPHFDDAGARAAVLATLKTWHGTAPLARPFDRLAELAVLMTEIEALAADGSKRGSQLPSGWAELRQAAADASALLSAIDFDPAPVHGEIVVSNILLNDAGGALLVDFDRAGTGDPMSDIAGLALEICPDPDSAEALLEQAFGTATDDLRTRLHLWQLVEDIYWGCWLRLAHFASPLSQAVEFYKLGTLRLDRAVGRMTQDAAPFLTRRSVA